MLIGHLPTDWQDQMAEVKQAAVEVGGRKNASCRFLSHGATDIMIKSSNTTVCRGVLQIPRMRDLPKDVIDGLDSGKLINNYTRT